MDEGMTYTKLGKTGLDVSRLCLGCMSFGDPGDRGRPWGIDEAASRAIVKRAVEKGINFFDTANVYSAGASEELLGRALKEYARREEIVLATKVNGQMHAGPNGKGLSRKSILHEVDKSLKRLGTDYIDLYIIHRWDDATPIEETLEALNDVVRAGKALYLGASSMAAWQFQKALFTADRRGWTRFVSMQNHYNLIQREEEREMLPLCAAEGVAVTPYSPLASGRLVRDWAQSTPRFETDNIARIKYDATAAEDKPVVERVAALAQKRGVTRTQIALAWLLHKHPVTSPIVGVTKLAQLDDAAGAVSVALSGEEVASLEEAYRPHATSFIK
jgi:aryl-alcohol dehydrogenase-like predicted oxidoreductase